MEHRPTELPAQDIGPGAQRRAGSPSERGEPPGWRVLAWIVAAVAALVAIFALGRASANSEPAAAPLTPIDETSDTTSDQAPSTAPTIEPQPTPALVDLLGEGTVVAEIDFGNRSRVVIWCRETVPGTRIGSTLALLYFGDSIRFGEQLIGYEELTQPWIPTGGRRGVVLETEGLGAGDFPTGGDDLQLEGAIDGINDGSRCEQCTPEAVTLDGAEALVGSCVHGVPLGAGIVYAVMAPTWPGQTPLALHATCGITAIRHEGDRLVIDAEAPLLRGIYDAEFPLPSMALERRNGWLESDDLELLDWYCDVERSSHLHGRHLLRTEPERRITYDPTESLIGEIGIHGPLAIGLTREQCSALTRAWWGRPVEALGTGSPIADLIGLDPPPGAEDWHYTCQLRSSD